MKILSFHKTHSLFALEMAICPAQKIQITLFIIKKVNIFAKYIYFAGMF